MYYQQSHMGIVKHVVVPGHMCLCSHIYINIFFEHTCLPSHTQPYLNCQFHVICFASYFIVPLIYKHIHTYIYIYISTHIVPFATTMDVYMSWMCQVLLWLTSISSTLHFSFYWVRFQGALSAYVRVQCCVPSAVCDSNSNSSSNYTT